MGNTLYAAFADAGQAEKAAGALLDHGVRAEDISLVRSTPEGYSTTEYQTAPGSTYGTSSDPSVVAGTTGMSTSDTMVTERSYGTDPDNDVKNTGDAAAGGVESVGNRVAEYGDRAAGAVADVVGADTAAANYRAAADRRDAEADSDASGAQREFDKAVDRDYNTAGTASTTSTTSMGSDYTTRSDGDNDVKNAGDAAVGGAESVGNRIAEYGDRAAGAVADVVGADTAAANYRAAADRRDAEADSDAAAAGREFNDSIDNNASTDSTYVRDGVRSTTTVRRSDDDTDDTDLAAKHGISTTTAADAGAGAVKGAGIGLGVGALAALAALMVPGFGLVVGGGALAAALGGVAATAGAGAAAGAVTGYLKDQGMEDHVVTDYSDAVTSGGALLAVHLPSGDVDEATARTVLDKYGATNVNTYATTSSSGYMA
jgi:hypothetical protein